MGRSQPLTPRLGPRQPRLDPLSDPRPFKLGNCPQDLHLELSGRRGRVDPFREADERHDEALEFFEPRNEMT